METRYIKPYFSTLILVLNKNAEVVPVQDQQGRQFNELRDENPQITAVITGWLSNFVKPDLTMAGDPTANDVLDGETKVVLNTAAGVKKRWSNAAGILSSTAVIEAPPTLVRSDNITFPEEPTNTPSMQDVLDSAKAMGVDVVDAWTKAFDAIADQFPQTAEQSPGAKGIGPSIALRPDAFKANLHPDRKKSILIKVGVYKSKVVEADGETTVDPYGIYQTSLNLVFEDGATKRERESNLVQLRASQITADLNLTQVNELINLKQTNQTLPDNINPRFANMTVEQLLGVVKELEQEIAYREAQIVELSSVITGNLNVLLGNTTPLHQSVMTSVGALCTAILFMKKASDPDYKDIDVAAIMKEFAIPDIS